MAEEGNGITARVHTLEAQTVDMKDSIATLVKTNSEEHKEIRGVVGRIQGIGWVIVGGLVVGILLRLMDKI